MEAQKAYGKQAHNIQVYMAKFCKDKPLMNMYDLPDWIIPIQAGAVLTAERVCCTGYGKTRSVKILTYVPDITDCFITAGFLTSERKT